MRNTFGLLGLAALIALMIVPAAASTTPVAALPNCLGKLEVRPASVVLACGDGGVYATGVRWSNWGSPFATATATMHANDCTPNCAQGHFHTYAAYLAVSGRQNCHGRLSYQRIAYVARTRGIPTVHSRLDWFESPCG